jgi:hypothetical protein
MLLDWRNVFTTIANAASSPWQSELALVTVRVP